MTELGRLRVDVDLDLYVVDDEHPGPPDEP